MSGIFICYRRDDSSGFAGWLYERLHQHFENDSLFMDVNTIDIGEDFVEAMQRAISSCDVLLVLIGPQWVSNRNASGYRRLDDPQDYVRLEIETALSRNIRVIPVLLQGAPMPRPDELPDALQALTRRQAFHLSQTNAQADVDRLIQEIETLKYPGKGRPNWPKRIIIASATVALLVITMIVAQFVPSSDKPPNPGAINDCQDRLDTYRKAAEQGDAEAQYELGNMYEHGSCVPQDYDKARRWYLQATAKRHAAAVEAYERLIGK